MLGISNRGARDLIGNFKACVLSVSGSFIFVFEQKNITATVAERLQLLQLKPLSAESSHITSNITAG